MVATMATIARYDIFTASICADAARRVLGEGGLIALPTESVYGLPVDPFDERALATLWKAKDRSEGNPTLLLIGDKSQIEPLV